jgi:hypothetical protein
MVDELKAMAKVRVSNLTITYYNIGCDKQYITNPTLDNQQEHSSDHKTASV